MAVLKYYDTISGTYVPLMGIISGTQIITGSGAPTNSIGANGDFYLDATAHILYGPKNSTATPVWPMALDGSGGGVGVRTYEQTFASPTTTWTVNHNLGSFDVEVNCFDLTGINEYDVEVDYVSTNQVIVRWYYPTAGIVRIIG